MRKLRIGIVALLLSLGCVQEHRCREGTVLVTFTFIDSPEKVDGVALSYRLDDGPLIELKRVERPLGTNQGRLALQVQNYKDRKQLLLRYAGSKGAIQAGPWLEMRIDLETACSTMNISLANVLSDSGTVDVPFAPFESSGAKSYDASFVSTLPEVNSKLTDTLRPMHDSGVDTVMDTFRPDRIPDTTLIPYLPDASMNKDLGLPPVDTAFLDVRPSVTVDVQPSSLDSFPDLNVPSDTMPDLPQPPLAPCPNGAPISYGQPCNSCGGTIQCDGTCKPGEIQDFGTSCGSCGGKITCNGTCSKTTPLDYGNPCNCTGTTLCDGSCTVAAAPDYNTDPNHCGGCGMACSNNHATPACTAGNCTSKCGSSNFYADCNADLRNDGCETAIFTDPKNCGQCGKICLGATQNESGLCGNSTKGVQCLPCSDPRSPTGKLNCDLDPSNGCEANTFNDENNCGGCGIVCPPGHVCMRPGTCQNLNPPDAAT